MSLDQILFFYYHASHFFLTVVIGYRKYWIFIALLHWHCLSLWISLLAFNVNTDNPKTVVDLLRLGLYLQVYDCVSLGLLGLFYGVLLAYRSASECFSQSLSPCMYRSLKTLSIWEFFRKVKWRGHDPDCRGQGHCSPSDLQPQHNFSPSVSGGLSFRCVSLPQRLGPTSVTFLPWGLQ